MDEIAHTLLLAKKIIHIHCILVKIPPKLGSSHELLVSEKTIRLKIRRNNCQSCKETRSTLLRSDITLVIRP